jgi:hypothetical protein
LAANDETISLVTVKNSGVIEKMLKQETLEKLPLTLLSGIDRSQKFPDLGLGFPAS